MGCIYEEFRIQYSVVRIKERLCNLLMFRKKESSGYRWMGRDRVFSGAIFDYHRAALNLYMIPIIFIKFLRSRAACETIPRCGILELKRVGRRDSSD
jgi:hypothetical protein